jgi:hypothetical protein
MSGGSVLVQVPSDLDLLGRILITSNCPSSGPWESQGFDSSLLLQKEAAVNPFGKE